MRPGGAWAGLLLAACQGTGSAPGEGGAWTAVELFRTEGKLGGCAIGELDPASAGLEAVAVSSEGRVVLARRAGGGWESEVLLEAPGELIQVAVGDLLPEVPGDEILAGGMARGGEKDGGPGAVWLLWREGQGWAARRLSTPGELVHAVGVLDFDPDRPGLEAVSAGFDLALRQFAFDGWPEVDERIVATLPSAAKGLVPVGEQVAVACAEGELLLQGRRDRQVLFVGGSGLARLAADGSDLLVSSNAGELYRLGGVGGASWAEVVFTEPGGAKGRGAVLAELDPRRPGLEWATAGYSGRVHVEGAAGAEPAAGRSIYDDGAPLHHLAAGELDPDAPGDELLTGGFSGRLVLLKRQP